MTIDKAIEILERRYVLRHDVPLAEQIEASILGIEALKRIAESRADLEDEFIELLPGETEE